MKKLDTKVNIIPIIAKADTISKTELQKFKVMSAQTSNTPTAYFEYEYNKHNKAGSQLTYQGSCSIKFSMYC